MQNRPLFSFTKNKRTSKPRQFAFQTQTNSTLVFNHKVRAARALDGYRIVISAELLVNSIKIFAHVPRGLRAGWALRLRPTDSAPGHTHTPTGGSGGAQTQRDAGYMYAIIMHQTEIVALIERARAACLPSRSDDERWCAEGAANICSVLARSLSIYLHRSVRVFAPHRAKCTNVRVQPPPTDTPCTLSVDWFLCKWARPNECKINHPATVLFSTGKTLISLVGKCNALRYGWDREKGPRAGSGMRGVCFPLDSAVQQIA